MALPLLAAVFAGCAANGDDYGYYDRRDYETAREERREREPSAETVRDEMYVEDLPADFSIFGYVGPDMIDSQSGFFDSSAPSYYTRDWFEFDNDSLSTWAGLSGTEGQSSGEGAQDEE